MLSSSSTPGASDEWLSSVGSIHQVQDSDFLLLCEKKPEIIFGLNHRTPLRQRESINPFFLDFLSNQNISVTEEYDHSSQTKNAFQKAIAKYCRPFTISSPQQRDYDLVDDWMYELISPFCLNSSVTPVPIVLEKSDLSASAGPLWRSFAKNKREFWVHEDGVLIYDAYRTEMAHVGSRSFFGLNLKDELRLKAKVLEEKTRLFMSAPFEHFLLLNSLSYSFNNSLIDSARYNLCPVAIGLPLFHGNVDDIGKKLESYSHVYCADVSGYDTSIQSNEHAFCAQLRWRCFAPRYKVPAVFNSLVNLYKDINLTPAILPDGVVILVPGQPSGHINTGMDNSLILIRRFMLVWVLNGGPRSFESFRDNVFIRAAGDDSVLGVSDFGSQFINSTTISTTFVKYFGCEIEFADELEFLGHYFVNDSGSYLPAFSKSRVFAALAYKDSHTPSDALEVALGLRIEAFTNDEALALVDSFSQYLLLKYPDLHSQYVEQFSDDIKINKLLTCSATVKLQSRTNHLSDLSENTTQKVFMLSRNVSLQQQAPRRTIAQSTVSSKTIKNRRKRARRRMRKQGQSRSLQNPNRNPRFVPRGDSRGGGATNRFESQRMPTTSGVRLSASSGPSQPNQQICDYIDTLINPATTASRYPDARSKKTGVVRSIQIIDIKANSAFNGGAVGINVRPTMGNVAIPNQYKTAITLPSIPDWSKALWDSPDPYVTNTAGAGINTDPRIDPLYGQLLAQAPGIAVVHANHPAGAGAGYPYGDEADLIDQLNSNGTPITYGYKYDYVTIAPHTSRFYMPRGQFFTYIDLVATTASGGPAVTLDFNVGSHYTQIDVDTGVINTTSRLNQTGLANFDGDAPWIDITADNPASVFTSCRFTFIPAFSPASVTDISTDEVYSPPMDCGIIQQYRPVGMSALFTYTASVLKSGGQIAAARLAGDSDKNNFFALNNSSSVGQLQYYNSVARTPGAYNGSLLDGAYVWWAPDDTDDCDFRSPADAAEHDFPSLVIALNYTPDDPVDKEIVIGRLEIVTVYEFTTQSTMFDLRASCCPSSCVEEATIYIANQPMAMKNGSHVEWIRNVISRFKQAARMGYDFYTNNSTAINSIVGAGLALL